MPSIPVYDYQASPSESSKPFIQDPGSVGGPNRAWQSAADQGMKRALQYQKEKAVLDASDALSALGDRERSLFDVELNNQGAKAVGAHSRGLEFYDTQAKEFSSGLSAPAAKLFNERVLQVRDAGLNRLSAHESQQHQVRKKDMIMTSVEQARQLIRNGTDQDTVSLKINEIQANIDAAYEGLNMTEMKNSVLNTISGEYLDYVSIKNPDGIYEAVDKWHGKIDTETLNKYLKKVDMGNAIESMNRDPDKFQASVYKSLDPAQQAHLQEQAIRLSESRLNKRVHEWDKAERDAEKTLKQRRESNEMTLLILQSQGRLNADTITAAAQARAITPEAFKQLMAVEREGYDDPVIVGEISSMVASRVDVTDALRSAWLSKKIKGTTYIELRKQIGNEEYWKGLTTIRGALEPGPMDKWSEDKNLKWAEGFSYYNQLVAGGAKPVEASQIVLDGHYGKVTRTISSLPKPLLWTGGDDMVDQEAVAATVKATAEKYANGNGQMSESVFMHEINLLKTLNKSILEELTRRRNQPQPTGSQTRKPTENRPSK